MGALLFAVASMHLWVDIESTVGQSRSWTVIDVASHPLRADVLLQSLSVNLGAVFQHVGLARSTMEFDLGCLSPTRTGQGRTRGFALRRFLDSD